MKRFVSLWLPVIFWMSLIFSLSSVPDLQSGLKQEVDIILRKLAHIGEYAVLTFLLARALSRYSLKTSSQRLLLLSFLLSLLYAVSDEVHQRFIPGREGALRDIAIDSIGITLALLLLASKNRVAKTLATYLRIKDV